LHKDRSETGNHLARSAAGQSPASAPRQIRGALSPPPGRPPRPTRVAQRLRLQVKNPLRQTFLPLRHARRPSPRHPRPLLEPGRQNPSALPIPFRPAPLAPPDRSLSPFPPCPSSAGQTPPTDPGGHQPTPARLAGAAPSARFPAREKVMDLLAFAYDQSFILEALRRGEIDYLEHVGEALE